MAGLKGRTNKPAEGENRNVRFTIMLSEKEVKKIEEIAKSVNIPKTRFARNLLLTSLDDAKLLHNLGILKGVKKVIDFKERLNNPNKYQNLPTKDLKAI